MAESEYEYVRMVKELNLAHAYTAAGSEQMRIHLALALALAFPLVFAGARELPRDGVLH
jgi:hypothetical protein